MKRFMSVILFLVLAIAVFFRVYYVAKQREEVRQMERNRLEVLRVYTDMPSELIDALDKPFTKESGVSVEVLPLTGNQILDDSLRTAESADVVITSQEILQQLDNNGQLAVFTSEQTDTVLNQYRAPDGTWTGVWLDPTVFVVNERFYNTNPYFLYTWDNVAGWLDVRISMTDFVSSSEAEDLLYCMAEHFGDEQAMVRLAQLGRHVVQYGKYLSTPCRMAAMNKVDIGISGYHEAIRGRKDHFPIKIIYPEDGEPWYLYGIGIYNNAKHRESAEQFVNWILSNKEMKELMEKSGNNYLLTNDELQEPDDRGNYLEPWELQKVFVKEGRRTLKRTWLSEVRFFQDNGVN